MSFIQIQEIFLQIIPKKIIKMKKQYSKPLPSLQFVQLLKSIIAKDQSKKNMYDSKFHTLTIGNWENFINALAIQHNRSIKSFERQLKMLGFKKKISQISDLTLKSKNEEVDKKSERSRFNPISKNINVFTPTKEYKNQDYIKKEDSIDYNSARQKQRKKEYIQERPISSCFSGFKKVNSLKQGENNQPITLAMNPYLKQRKKSSFDKVQPQKIPKSETLINLSLLLSDLDQSKIKQEHNKREDLKGQYSQKYEKSEQPQKNEIVSYIWRGNKQLLINKKITSFEICLRTKIYKNQQLIESIRKKREKMDKLMENLIFNMMLNGQETQVNIPQRIQQQKGGKVSNPSRNGILMRNAVQEMRQMVNEVQLKSNLIGSDISDVLASELELYRMLIYKEKQKNGNTSSVDNNAEQQQKQN